MARIKNLFGKDQTCILCVWCLFFVEGIFFLVQKLHICLYYYYYPLLLLPLPNFVSF